MAAAPMTGTCRAGRQQTGPQNLLPIVMPDKCPLLFARSGGAPSAAFSTKTWSGSDVLQARTPTSSRRAGAACRHSPLPASRMKLWAAAGSTTAEDRWMVGANRTGHHGWIEGGHVM